AVRGTQALRHEPRAALAARGVRRRERADRIRPCLVRAVRERPGCAGAIAIDRGCAGRGGRMKRQLVLPVVVVALVVLIVLWASRNMTWTEITVPAMYKGEALTNPLYGAKRLVEQLGGRGQWDRVLTDPPTDGVIVLTAWHWNL